MAALDIGQLVVSLGIDTRGVYAEQLRFQKQLTSMKKDLDGAADSIQKTGRGMLNFYSYGYRATRMLTLPLVLFGGAAVKAFSDYEASMTKVIALTGASREEAKLWGDAILELAPLISRSPQELAEAMYFVSSAGFKGAEALKIVASAGQAAAVGLGETKDVASLLTSAMNAYRLEGLSAAYATDILVAAVREGKAEAVDFAHAMGQVIPIAAEMGVSFDQVAGAMAAMTLTGSSASNAAVYLKGILNSLMDPAKQTEDLLRAMGSSSRQLKETLANQGLMPALQEIRKLTEEWGVDTLGKIFPNIRAMIGFLSLTGQNLDYNNKLMDRVKNSYGDTAKAVEATSRIFKWQWNSAVSEGKTVLITLGETIAKTFLPIFKSLVNWVSGLTRWFNSLSESMRKVVVWIAAIVAASGPLYLVFGFLLSNIIPGLVRALKWMLIPAINAVKPALQSLAVWCAVNPYMALVGALGILASAYLFLGRRTKQAADAQKLYNKELSQQTIDLGLEKAKIDALMKSSTGMNPRQLQTLKDRIDRQIELEQDATIAIQAEYKTRIEEDKTMLALKKKLHTATGAAEDAAIKLQINMRRIGLDFEGKALKEEEALMKTRLEDYTKYSKALATLLLGKSGQKYKDVVLAETILNMRLATATIAENTKVWGGLYDDVADRIKMVTDAINDLAKRRGELVDPKDADKVAEINDELAVQVAEYNKLIKLQLATKFNEIAVSSRYLGDTFESSTAKVKLYQEEFDKWSKAAARLGPNFQLMGEYGMILGNVLLSISNNLKQAQVDAVVESGRKLVSVLEAEAFLYTKLDSEIMILNEKMNVQKKIMDTLVAVGWGLSEAFFFAAAAWKKLNEQMVITEGNKAVQEAQVMADAFQSMDTQIELLNQKIAQSQRLMLFYGTTMGITSDQFIKAKNDFINFSNQLDELESRKQVFQILANAASELGTVIGNAFYDSGQAWWGFVDLILRTAGEVVSALLYVAMAAVASKNVSKFGVKGLIFAAIGIAALTAAWAGYKQQAQKAAKMARGGIIPSGYPNDSYPAMLSSGEKVIPAPKSLDAGNFMGNGVMKIEFVGDLKGKDIYFSLKRYLAELESTT